MSKSEKQKMTGDEQRRRFIEAAREIGADEDPEAFKERLKRLVKGPTPPRKQKQQSKRSPVKK